MERERNSNTIELDRLKGEISMLNDRVRQYEEDLRIKQSEIDDRNDELN